MPENSAFRYDEMIPAKNVHVKRFIEDYHDNPASRVAQKEFSDNTRLFIDELKRDARAEGFIIRNLRTKNGGLQRVLKELESEKVDLSRIQTIRKTRYITYYPELMTVTISPQ